VIDVKCQSILCILGIFWAFVPVNGQNSPNPTTFIPRADHQDKKNVNAPHTVSYGNIDRIALADVQDRIDTIDQLGLYVLLNCLEDHTIPKSQMIDNPSPQKLLQQPELYRGQLLQYEVIFGTELRKVKLARPKLYNQDVFCLPAQIPCANNLLMPAIIVLPTAPANSMVDRAVVRGYFYMILRAQPAENDAHPGPDILDYLVLVAQNLDPIRPAQSQQRQTSFGSLWFSLGSLLVLLTIWAYLRRRVSRSYLRTRHRTLADQGEIIDKKRCNY